MRLRLEYIGRSEHSALVGSAVVESPEEHAYRLYQAGETPEQAHAQLRIGPVFAAHGGGVSLSARF